MKTWLTDESTAPGVGHPDIAAIVGHGETTGGGWAQLVEQAPPGGEGKKMELLKSAVWQTVKETLRSMPDFSSNAEGMARHLADQIEREAPADEVDHDRRQRLRDIPGSIVI